MGTQRSSIKRGPGVALFNGATIFTKDDINQNLEITTAAPDSAMHGKLDERLMDRSGEVSLTPVGEWEDFAVLWPYRDTLPGASLFGDDDVPLVIHSLDGEKHTWKAAAVTGMPEITFGVGNTMIGPAQFGCVIADGGDWEDEGALLAIAAEAFPGATWPAFDITKVPTETPTISWATAPPTPFLSQDGVTISFDLQFEWTAPDETGRIDATLSSVGVMARFKPFGMAASDLLALMKIQGAGTLARGARLITNAFDLTVSNTVGSAVLHKAALVREGFTFGRTTLRAGEIGFVAARSFTGGLRDPLWTLAAAE